MRRAGQTTVALLLACLAVLAAAPVAAADVGVPLWPVDSFALLLGGFVGVLVILIVSAAILGRISRAERERRLDAQYETRLAERGSDPETLAVTDRAAGDPAPKLQEGDHR